MAVTEEQVQDVIKVFEIAKINAEVLGNKEATKLKADGVHHLDQRYIAAMRPDEARKEEALKLVPYLTNKAQPTITRGAVVAYMKQSGLSMDAKKLATWLDGKSPAKTVTERVQAQHAEGVTITKEQHQFYELLLASCKTVAPEILKTVIEAMQEQKLREAQDRIKKELYDSMGSIGSLLEEINKEPTPEVEYEEEMIDKANKALADKLAGEKVPAATITAARLVLDGKQLTEAQEKLFN